MEAFRTELVADNATLAGLEPEWWALWRRSPGASPFSSPAWLLPWWEVFRPGALSTVAVRRGGRLVALAPCFLDDDRDCGVERLKPLGLGLSDLCDVLLDPDEAGAGAALVAATADLGRWASWEMEAARDDAATLALPLAAGCAGALHDQDVRPVLAIGPDDPLAAIPARKRRKLRMAQHRADRRGGVVAPVAGDDVPAFLDDLTSLHGARWRARGETGVLDDAAVRRFHALALPRLAQAGLAHLFRCRIAGTVAGAFYGLRDRRTAYAYIGGFDPAFAFESPGTLLLGEAIAAAGRAGATAFDFLRGDEPYKYEWGAANRWSRHRRMIREPVDA